MPKRRRRSFTLEFKARVVLDVLRQPTPWRRGLDHAQRMIVGAKWRLVTRLLGLPFLGVIQLDSGPGPALELAAPPRGLPG